MVAQFDLTSPKVNDGLLYVAKIRSINIIQSYTYKIIKIYFN